MKIFQISGRIRSYSVFLLQMIMKDTRSNDIAPKDTSSYLTNMKDCGKIEYVQGYVIIIGGNLWLP